MIAIFGLINIGWGVAGFVIGALVFRNNPKKGEEIVQELKDRIAQLEAKIK